MRNLVDKTFTWVIKDFPCLEIAEKIYSDEFVIDGCKWRLKAIPHANEAYCLSLYLEVADFESLPSGWIIFASFSLAVENHFAHRNPVYRATDNCFDHMEPDFGCKYMLPLSRLEAIREGFLINGEVRIVAVVEFTDPVGILDVPNESEEVTQTLRNLQINDDGAASSGVLKENPAGWVDVHGFLVFSAQADLARRVFEAHPEIALECRTKNQEMRTSYMNVLLGLIRMLEKWPQEHSEDDLSYAEATLAYMKSVGFKVDWLEKKFDKVKGKRKEGDRSCEMRQQLNDLEKKCNDLKTLVIQAKEEVSEVKNDG
ncbi:unnamed protein product [Microthlaspi erraticum]|uniref:MATH domain-containing protein n=1 Tax=Microthlaspi erraticum TaxID=1685480 RepID=A0A6D2L8A7_9BRAS|nr:unnamed protein product [Microthlaspi erraticum]